MLSAVAILAGGVLFAPLPAQVFNSVVAIGRTMPDGSRAWIGSGFLYAYLDHPDLKGESRYRSYIVTNRHVLVSLSEILVRFNPGSLSPETRAETMTVRLVDAEGKQLWMADETLDVGAIPWAPPRDVVMRLKNLGFIIGEAHIDPTIMAPGTILSRRLRESDAAEGDEVFLPGFPIGVMTDQLFGANRNYPVLRRGMIAWIQPALENLTPDFLVDALIFPGNSGGPVLRQCAGSAAGEVCLIGMVKSYLPYSDVASSRQTGRPRVTFEENSGLAVVIPVDQIDRTIAEHLRGDVH